MLQIIIKMGLLNVGSKRPKINGKESGFGLFLK